MSGALERILWEVGSKALEAVYEHAKEKYGADHPKIAKALASIDIHNENEPVE